MDRRILYDRLFEMQGKKHFLYENEMGRAVQSPGAPLWIWLRDASLARPFFYGFLAAYTGDVKELGGCGLVVARDAAQVCGDILAAAVGVPYSLREMRAYSLTEGVMLPSGKGVKGKLRRMGSGDWLTVLGWIKAFYTETLEASLPGKMAGADAAQGEVTPTEKKMPEIYVWDAEDGNPTAMGMLTQGTEIRRLNLIFCPKEKRRRGYARALVAGLCALVHNEGKIPMLYVYGDNTGAVKLYEGLGFVMVGAVTEVRFR